VAKLVQATDLLQINGGILVQPQDVEARWASATMSYAALCLSDKPLLGVQGQESQARRIMELGTIAFGGEAEFKREPHFLFLVNTLSPLQIDAQALATIKVCAQYNQALILSPGVITGLTAPITPLGSMVQANAEFLAGLCVSQILSPGLPVVFGCKCAQGDMRSGGLSTSSPNGVPFTTWATGLAEKYRLPNRGMGAVTDAGQVSVQSGYEALLMLSCDFANRTSLVVHAAGILGGYAAFSFEQFMVDLELIRLLNRANEAFHFDEDDLALEVIREVGPGGEFLTHPHTVKHCRRVPFLSTLAPPMAENPEIFQDEFNRRIQRELDQLEQNYQRPEMAPEIQGELRACMSRIGVPDKTLREIAVVS
jgi:trimethylamine--corrinoid protein Co-methyltransferase